MLYSAGRPAVPHIGSVPDRGEVAPHTKLTLGAIYPRSKLTLPPRISAKLRLALSISELLIHVCYHDPIYAEGQLSACLYHDRRIDKVVYLHHILLLGPNSYDS